MKRLFRSCIVPTLLLLTLGGFSSLGGAGDPSPVRELRTQQVGDVTYFHVRLETPREMLPDVNRLERGWWSEPTPSLAPRLVAEDQIRLVCQRFDPNQRNRFGLPPEFDVPPPGPPPVLDRPAIKDKDSPKDAGPQPPRERRPRLPVPVQGLEFVGQTTAKGEVKLKLIYPSRGSVCRSSAGSAATRRRRYGRNRKSPSTLARPALSPSRKRRPSGRKHRRRTASAGNRRSAMTSKGCGPSPRPSSSSTSTTR